MSLLNDDSDGGNGSNNNDGSNNDKPWQEAVGLSEDYRKNPTIAQAKDINALAKMTIEAQALVGKDKIPAPTDKWEDADWAEHYKRLGLPDTADEYGTPDVTKWDNVPDGFEIQGDELKGFKESLHKHGVSKKQGEAIIQDILQTNLGKFRENLSANDKAREDSINSLKEEFGADFDSKITVAKSVLKQYGDDNLAGFLEETGLADNADMVRLLTKIGSALSEDNASGGSNSFQLNGTAAAMQELEQLKADPDFMRRTWDTEDPGHHAAKQRWMDLNNRAYSKAS